jgi:FixJ family two-component response regulator
MPPRRASVPRIAIVDDDDVFRESLEGWLTSLGFTVRPFASAEAYLGSDAREATDCLILDIRMPGMSGPQLQRALREGGHRIPIIFITAHGDEAIGARAREGGAVDCLLKPFSEEVLLSAIHAALGAG